MDLITILTIIGCFSAMTAVMITLFLHLANKIDNIQTSIHQEMCDFHNAIKDFHGRLCSLEERRK